MATRVNLSSDMALSPFYSKLTAQQQQFQQQQQQQRLQQQEEPQQHAEQHPSDALPTARAEGKAGKAYFAPSPFYNYNRNLLQCRQQDTQQVADHLRQVNEAGGMVELLRLQLPRDHPDHPDNTGALAAEDVYSAERSTAERERRRAEVAEKKRK